MGEVHDTPVRPEPFAVGMGTRWLAHVVPFQARASGLPPSAVQAVADGHDTAFSGPPDEVR